MDKKTQTIIGVIVIILCIVGVGMALKGSVVPYITVTELKSGDYAGEYVQVNGTVVDGSVDWHPKDILLNFKLTDGRETIDVEYRASIPNNFEEGKMVVVGGIYEANLFRAEEILVKCPSKYTEEIE